VIRYQVEKFDDALPDMAPFFQDHMEEVGADKSQFPLSPDIERYRWMQERGDLCLVTVRDDGKLIGYYCAVLMRHLHYDSRTAYTDVFYLAPDRRQGTIGIKLFKAAEDVLRMMGVERIYTGTKLKLDIGPILERLGYKPIERIYTKVTKGGANA